MRTAFICKFVVPPSRIRHKNCIRLHCRSSLSNSFHSMLKTKHIHRPRIHTHRMVSVSLSKCRHRLQQTAQRRGAAAAQENKDYSISLSHTLRSLSSNGMLFNGILLNYHVFSFFLSILNRSCFFLSFVYSH